MQFYLFIYLKFTGSLKPLKRQIGSDSWYRVYLHGCAIAVEKEVSARTERRLDRSILSKKKS